MIRPPKPHKDQPKFTKADICFKNAISKIKHKCKDPIQNFDKIKPMRLLS